MYCFCVSTLTERVETSCIIRITCPQKNTPITSFILNVYKIIVKKINYLKDDLTIPIIDRVLLVRQFFLVLAGSYFT